MSTVLFKSIRGSMKLQAVKNYRFLFNSDIKKKILKNYIEIFLQWENKHDCWKTVSKREDKLLNLQTSRDMFQ